jgi:hypothetical protein
MVMNFLSMNSSNAVSNQESSMEVDKNSVASSSELEGLA